MPLGDGKGPPWGSGPGTGQRRGRCGGDGRGTGDGNESQSLIIIGSIIALVTSVVKFLSSKKHEEKEQRR